MMQFLLTDVRSESWYRVKADTVQSIIHVSN